MEQSDLLRHLAHVLDEMQLRYFVTGSTATIFYGEPRFTNDIDVVVDLSESQVSTFCNHFPAKEFYLSEEAVRDAVRSKTQFNIIHPVSGLKVDVIIPEPTSFNQSRFTRVRRLQAGDDFQANFSSPEDAIIKKMDYYRMGASEKHLRDITGILKTSANSIDIAYVMKWAKTLGLEDIWAAILQRAAI